MLISHSHGSEIGEETAFEAEVVLKPKAHSRDLGQTENIIYEFSWKVTDLEWIRQNKTTHRWNSFRWRWFSEGQKTVFVFVRIIVGTEYNSRNSSKRKQSQSGHTLYYARNHTQITVYGTEEKISASLEAYQNSSQDIDQFIAGTVNLAVIINSPNRYVNLSYDWYFGDGTRLLNSCQSQLSHNFTTVRSCTVKVVIYGFYGGKRCKGVAFKDLQFTANVKAYLVINCLPGPKLPSDEEKIAINIPARFEVKFKDPFKEVTSVSIDWDFGDGSRERNSSSYVIFHKYRKEREYHVWVTVRVKTRHHKAPKLPLISKNVFVKAPVSLKVRHKNVTKGKPVAFHISCNGSLPVSFRWCVSRLCSKIQGSDCSPSLEHNNSCYLIVNHTFRNSGNFCVSVGVMNGVSNTNTSLILQIPESLHSIKPAQKRSKDKAAKGAIIAIFVICLLIGVIVIVVRKLYYRKREKIEKANFDFRDSDDISLSSLQLFEKPSCFPWCGNRTSCGAECVPLCDHAAGRKLYTL